MTLRQLHYFKNISELEHFTLAAKKSLVSQSSLSHAIQELERELNVELFKKRGRNVELTKYGQLFLPYVQETLSVLESRVAKLKNSVNTPMKMAPGSAFYLDEAENTVYVDLE